MRKAFLICLTLLSFARNSYAQFSPPHATDTVRKIQIIRGLRERGIMLDSVTQLETIAGQTILREGKTLFESDSVVYNSRLSTIESFGKVHINDADTLNIYAEYLKYVGNDRTAFLKKNVRLSDKKGTLLTNELEYNLRTGIGIYRKGGKVVNGKTVLTSDEGTYYSDFKEVHFKKNVKIKGPDNTVTADSLIYNTITEKVTLTGPTHIKNKGTAIYTTEGTYDLRSGNAFFANRTMIHDSSGRSYQADRIAIDNKSGVTEMEGNAIIKDSANGIIVLGNQIFLDTRTNTFRATKKPVMIIKREKDSTYISADTLFSGITKREKTVFTGRKKTTNKKAAADTSLTGVTLVDTSAELPDTLKQSRNINLSSDTTVRYFIAFRNVRIFNDSLQSVCDSLFYSDQDSIFRLFRDPAIWSSKTQVTGDTIYLFTKNKKAERVYVFNNGMIINKTLGGKYNQMAGKTINAYLLNGSINYCRVKGSPAESIYYLLDKANSFIGMNRETADVIDLYFQNDDLHKVMFVNNAKGRLFPIRQIPAPDNYLKNFSWQEKRRPKNKLELFE